MENKQNYERIVKQACAGNVLMVRIAAYIGYAAFALLWLSPIISSLFNPLLIALAVLTTVILVLLTRKYLHIEFEYSFVGGTLTVSKIYGRKKRKILLCEELRSALWISPITEEALARAESMSPTKICAATASPSSSSSLLLVFDTEKKERVLLLIESDERTLAICRRVAPASCAGELRRNI